MSETKGAKKTEKPGFFTRAKNWIVALPGRISGAFKNMVAELKKVVVIAFVVVLAIVVGLLDTGSSFLVKKLIEL